MEDLKVFDAKISTEGKALVRTFSDRIESTELGSGPLGAALRQSVEEDRLRIREVFQQSDEFSRFASTKTTREASSFKVTGVST